MSLNCQKCNHAALSVAAMNLKETQETDKKGNFSGGGVGVGTGGLGILGGGGTYSGTEEIHTKRAKIFTPPEVTIEPIMNKFFLAISAFVLFTIGIPLIQHFANQVNETSDIISSTLHGMMLNPVFSYSSPIIGIVLAIVLFRSGLKDVEENEKLEREETPKILARYRELFYCENCNLLFDDRQNIKDGSKLGFDAMMEIPAKTESLNLFQVQNS